MRATSPLLRFMFAVCLLAFGGIESLAQTWQWGKRGGGSNNGAQNNISPEESIVDMATDAKGNVYALAIIEAFGNPTFTGGSFTAYGDRDVALLSFRCDGTLRWRKTIGGGTTDFSFYQQIGVDTMGHLYVSGSAISSQNATSIPLSFEGDTTLPGTNQKMTFLAQYDTSGNLNWLRQPMPDTAALSSGANWQILSMAISGNGDAYCLAYLRPGLLGGSSQVVTTAGVYMMRYNTQGILVSITPIQMGFVPSVTFFSSFHLARTTSGKFVVAGAYPINLANFTSGFSLGGQPVTNSAFVACFSQQGTVLWKKFSNDSATGLYGRPALDAQGNIYLAGSSKHNSSFNGTLFSNAFTTIGYALPIAVKLDSNGNNIWAKNGSVADAVTFTTAGVLRGSEFVLVGAYAGKLTFPGLPNTLIHAQNVGNDVFLARVDAQTGQSLLLDSITGSGFYDFATSLASDKSGNVYVGGRFQTNISIGGAVYNSAGGASDFFIAKYGVANCNCTVPTAVYTKTQNTTMRTVSVTYTGPTTGLDSVVWQWGDGTKLKVTSNYGAVQTKTYPANAGSSFNVCATAYSSCGQNQTCQTVGFPTSIANIAAFAHVHIYPNPTTDALTIEGGAVGTRYSILSLIGQEVQRGTVASAAHTLSLAGLPTGPYLLVLTSSEGVRGSVRISKL